MGVSTVVVETNGIRLLFVAALVVVSAWLLFDTRRACFWLSWGQKDTASPKVIPILRLLAGFSLLVGIKDLIRLGF